MVRPNFSFDELKCRRTGLLVRNEDALDALQALRDLLGVPLHVVSAYRSPAHNRAVGGAPASLHMEGRAFDLRWPDMPPLKFLSAAHVAGFKGLGVYHNFVHLDTGEPRFWTDLLQSGD